MKKSVLILVPILLVILIVAGVGIGIMVSNNQSDPSKNGGNDEIEEVRVDFFGGFEPFECNGDYTSYSYISDVMNQNGTRFYARSSFEDSEHNNVLAYVLSNGEEKTLFSISNSEVDVEVMSFIDDALYFNISNSEDMGVNGLYRMWLGYNEAGEVVDSSITLRFDQNLEPIRAEDNMILLRVGEQYFIFDTQTGECSAYN